MESVTEEIKKIEDAKADIDIRVIRRIEIGHAVHQGDVYIHRVADNHAMGKQIGKDSVQIALGIGNGARHMAEGPVKVFEGKCLPDGVGIVNVDPEKLTGPCIVADDVWMLTHPEHAHHQLPAGVYQTTYQYDPKTMQRVRD